MSDGNFNRALLPHTPYASGLKTGKSIARVRALEAFQEWLLADQPTLSDDAAKAKTDAFAALLSQKIV